jgi:hypothetical protein
MLKWHVRCACYIHVAAVRFPSTSYGRGQWLSPAATVAPRLPIGAFRLFRYAKARAGSKARLHHARVASCSD